MQSPVVLEGNPGTGLEFSAGSSFILFHETEDYICSHILNVSSLTLYLEHCLKNEHFFSDASLREWLTIFGRYLLTLRGIRQVLNDVFGKGAKDLAVAKQALIDAYALGVEATKILLDQRINRKQRIRTVHRLMCFTNDLLLEILAKQTQSPGGLIASTQMPLSKAEWKFLEAELQAFSSQLFARSSEQEKFFDVRKMVCVVLLSNARYAGLPDTVAQELFDVLEKVRSIVKSPVIQNMIREQEGFLRSRL